jgi:hypothetical protein
MTQKASAVDGLAFDGELVLQPADRIVVGVERACDGFEPGERERRLFSGIDHDFRTKICQAGQAAQARQRRLGTGDNRGINLRLF